MFREGFMKERNLGAAFLGSTFYKWRRMLCDSGSFYFTLQVPVSRFELGTGKMLYRSKDMYLGVVKNNVSILVSFS